MLHPDQINWVAVLVAAVAHQAIGFVWYGLLFARTWQQAVGRTDAEVNAGAMRAFAIASVGALVMAAALALLLTAVSPVDLATGATFGLIVGVGFVAASAVINGAYEDRRPVVTLLFAGYEILACLAMGAILGAIR